ncbi:hypothetical protein A3Q56_08136, partial [Intoshia linei]
MHTYTELLKVFCEADYLVKFIFVRHGETNYNKNRLIQ